MQRKCFFFHVISRCVSVFAINSGNCFGTQKSQKHNELTVFAMIIVVDIGGISKTNFRINFIHDNLMLVENPNPDKSLKRITVLKLYVLNL